LLNIANRHFSPLTSLIAMEIFQVAVPGGRVRSIQKAESLMMLPVLADQIAKLGLSEEAVALVKRALAATYLTGAERQYDIESYLHELGLSLPERPDPQIMFQPDLLTRSSTPPWYQPEGLTYHYGNPSWKAATNEQRSAVYDIIERDSHAYLDRVAPMPDLAKIAEKVRSQLPEPLALETSLREVVSPLLEEVKNVLLTIKSTQLGYGIHIAWTTLQP
jgi:hypothetical protein